MLAEEVGKELAGCNYVAVGFAGGMSELAYINARTILVNDVHRHVINLASVIGSNKDRLADALSSLPFHPDVLRYAQMHCMEMERAGWDFGRRDTASDEVWAVNYFICCWMGRSAKAGTKDEFKGALPIRYTTSGGDSNVRYRSAIESLDAWSAIMRRCNFSTDDVFVMLDKIKDVAGTGIYNDQPFPGPGDDYKHTFDESKTRQLAERVAKFQNARVVCRFYDHQLIRELYPEGRWTWRRLKGRDQANNATKPEVLIVNRSSYAEADRG